MTIKWNGDNWDKFKKTIPNYIKTSTVGQCIDTGDIHIFTNIGIVDCKIGQFIIFPPKESIRFYKSSL